MLVGRLLKELRVIVVVIAGYRLDHRDIEDGRHGWRASWVGARRSELAPELAADRIAAVVRGHQVKSLAGEEPKG